MIYGFIYIYMNLYINIEIDIDLIERDPVYPATPTTYEVPSDSHLDSLSCFPALFVVGFHPLLLYWVRILFEFQDLLEEVVGGVRERSRC